MTTISPEDRARLRRQRTEQAIQLAIQSRWEDAVAVNQQLVQLFPQDVEAWNRLGKALTELVRYGEARNAYSKALELDPVNQIAKKNLQRLAALEPRKEPVAAGPTTLDPALFIAETGKSGQHALINSDLETLKALTPGEQVFLQPVGSTLTVVNAAGQRIGDVEPRLGLRLVRLMEGGNQYAAWLTSQEEGGRILIKETLQHPSQAGRMSFPPTGIEGFRAYTKETLLHYDLEEEEEGAEHEEWAEPPEPTREILGGVREVPLAELAEEEEPLVERREGPEEEEES